ncbi:tetratricopeptide repeat protein [Hyalangium versicolor]|uniref:tetratricopeptide repeat protein n=1 Tax=Hyalangium versicolor TaxID=2861190 RepID=UPI001CCAC68C|nr:tetratricopeptide repeat protein [Hyalangium versicolor]
MRSVLALCGLAFLVHLVPLFLPRNMPEQELAIARATPEARFRVPVLKPLKNNPKATAADLREAAELLVEGAPGDAQELVDEADRREPGSVETQLLRARICRAERMERCVRESFEQATKLAPGDTRPDLLWADMREQDGELADAAEAVGRATKKAPEDLALRLRYSRLLSASGKAAEAEQALWALEAKLPREKLFLELGMLRKREGRNEEARGFFSRAVAEGPRSAVAHYHLGMAQFQLGDLDSAEEELREADRLNVSDPQPLASLCAMQMKAGRLEDARITRMDLERRFQNEAELIQEACRRSR